jgi:hypothetical protein
VNLNLNLSPQDRWKLVRFLIFVVMAVAGHTDKLPPACQPAAPYFEFFGWLGGMYQAWAIQSPHPDGTR